MSSKKEHHTRTGAEKSPDDNLQKPDTAGAETPQQAAPSMLDLQSQLDEALNKAAEYKDGWQRSVADFQNYRRRTESEKAETYQLAVGNIIRQYLPVLDDLERALESRPADLAWANGIELIYRKLLSILETENIKRIEVEGQKFDPNFHEAISAEPVQEVESGTILAVIRNGYMLGERVIRPAMVRVAQ